MKNRLVNVPQWRASTKQFLFKTPGVILTLLLVSLVSACQSTQPPSPGELTQEELAQVLPKLESFVESGKLAGFATLVAHKGEIVHLGALGVRDLETGEPVTADTIMRIYSMTKPVTSAAVMMLIERGEINLDDQLQKYIPAFANMRVYVGETNDGEVTTVPANRPITIKDLLTHTSGLTYGISGDNAVHKQYDDINYMKLNMTVEEFADKVAKIPLIAQPGGEFNYSVSTSILGRVIEVVSGQTLGDFMAANIYQPLGMKDTGFYVPADKLDRFSDLHITDENGEFVVYDDNKNGQLSGKAPLLELGGGGLVSTLSDYYRFCQMIMNKGELDGVRVLKSSTVEQMTQSHLSADAPSISLLTFELTGVGFGYGLAVTQEPSLLMSHATAPGDLWWGGFSTTLFWIDPREEIVGVLMAQQLPSASAESQRLTLRSELRKIVYKALER